MPSVCYSCGYCLDSIVALREFGQNPVDDKEDKDDGDNGRHTIEIVYSGCEEDIKEDNDQEEEKE